MRISFPGRLIFIQLPPARVRGRGCHGAGQAAQPPAERDQPPQGVVLQVDHLEVLGAKRNRGWNIERWNVDQGRELTKNQSTIKLVVEEKNAAEEVIATLNTSSLDIFPNMIITT